MRTVGIVHTVSNTNIPIPTVAALRLAAAAECDPRTAARALREGTQVIRVATVRERLERAMREMAEPAHA